MPTPTPNPTPPSPRLVIRLLRRILTQLIRHTQTHAPGHTTFIRLATADTDRLFREGARLIANPVLFPFHILALARRLRARTHHIAAILPRLHAIPPTDPAIEAARAQNPAPDSDSDTETERAAALHTSHLSRRSPEAKADPSYQSTRSATLRAIHHERQIAQKLNIDLPLIYASRCSSPGSKLSTGPKGRHAVAQWAKADPDSPLLQVPRKGPIPGADLLGSPSVYSRTLNHILIQTLNNLSRCLSQIAKTQAAEIRYQRKLAKHPIPSRPSSHISHPSHRSHSSQSSHPSHRRPTPLSAALHLTESLAILQLNALFPT